MGRPRQNWARSRTKTGPNPVEGTTASPRPPASPLFLLPSLPLIPPPQPRAPALPKHIARVAGLAIVYRVAKGTQGNLRGGAPRAPAQWEGSPASLSARRRAVCPVAGRRWRVCWTSGIEQKGFGSWATGNALPKRDTGFRMPRNLDARIRDLGKQSPGSGGGWGALPGQRLQQGKWELSGV